MKKRSERENLKSFSWIYIIVAIFFVVSTIICNFMPELSKPISEAFAREGLDGMTLFNVSAGITVLINLWYFWLSRRVADGKSEGNLYMVLLILGIIGSVLTFFTTKSYGRALSFDAVIDICGLYYLLKVRNSK